MRTKSSRGLVALAALGLAASAASSADAAVVAYTGTGATAGSNTGNLNIGRQFAVSGTGVTIRDLGVFDNAGDGLLASHTVTLFQINSGAGAANANVTAVGGGSVTVPSGTAAQLDTGFRYAALSAPIFLAPGNYSVVAYGMNVTGADAFGNGGGFPANGNVTDIRFDPFSFTAATSPTYPTAGDTNNHSGASFRYDLGNTVPEPGAAAIGLMAAGGILAGRRRGRR